MSLYRHKGAPPRGGWLRRSIASIATGALTLVLLTAPPAAADTPDTAPLNVGFAGSFGDNNSYTKADGEVVTGSLQRLAGTETIANGAVTLAGTTTGIQYTSNEASPFASEGEDANKKIRAEMIFTPPSRSAQLCNPVLCGRQPVHPL